MPTYLERYCSGQYTEVWNELLTLGPTVRDESIAIDALAVARETMRRVRLNIDTLIPHRF